MLKGSYYNQNKHQMIELRNNKSRVWVRKLLIAMDKLKNQIKNKQPINILHLQLCQVFKSMSQLTQVSKQISLMQIKQVQKCNSYEQYNKLLKQIKVQIMNIIMSIYQNKYPFQIASTINDEYIEDGFPKQEAMQICDQLFHMMNLHRLNKVVQQKHVQKISQGFKTQLNKQTNNVIQNKQKGANPGFIVTTKQNQHYYCKTFTQVKIKVDEFTFRKIDCCQMFGYKVLQLMGFGPETHFIIQQYSEEDPQDYEPPMMRVKGNYIVTRNVIDIRKHQINQISHRQFIRDSEYNKFSQIQQAVKNEQFLVQLFAIMCLNQILTLGDTFFDNCNNFGIIKSINRKGQVNYQPILIDHLPKRPSNNVNLSIIACINKLLCKFREQSQHRKSNIKKIINIINQQQGEFEILIKKLQLRVIEKVKNGKKGRTLEQSINLAYDQISNLIKCNGQKQFYQERVLNSNNISPLQQILTLKDHTIQKIRNLFHK